MILSTIPTLAVLIIYTSNETVFNQNNIDLYQTCIANGSSRTYMNRRCDLLLETIKDNRTIENVVSKERIINTDNYCLGKPNTKRVHIR